MAVQGMVGGSASTRHAVRVDWFGRDPSGGTIFVLPAGGDGAAPLPIPEHDDNSTATAFFPGATVRRGPMSDSYRSPTPRA